MTKYVGLFMCNSLLVLLFSLLSVNCQYGCDNPDGILAGSDLCYTFHEQTLDWSAARTYCADQNGKLPVVTDSVTSSLLRDLLRARSLNDTWLGASASHEDNYDWFWISDGSRIDLQGCYHDVFGTPDLPDAYLTQASQVLSLTDTLCISECANPSNGHAPYKYAGVQSGDSCFCGDDYGTNWQHKMAVGCSLFCIGDNSRRKCGGNLKNYVYYVSGSYAEWTRDQPDGQSCAVLNSMELGSRLYADQHCNSQFAFVCQIGDAANCPTTTGYDTAGGKCYYVSPTDAYNWFEAQEQCVQKGGNLAKISDESERIAVSTMLENSGATAAHWIGLTRMNWKWKTSGGVEEDLSYTDWSSTLTPPEMNISISQEFCMMSAAADDYMWSSGSCFQNLTVVCQHSTSSDLTTGNPGNNETDPQLGQSTGDDDDGLTDFQIVLIVAFCILVVAIVVTTVLFVYFNKKKGQQVAPAPGGGYDDKASPAVASGSHGNGDISRSEDGSTVGLVMQPGNDVFT